MKEGIQIGFICPYLYGKMFEKMSAETQDVL